MGKIQPKQFQLLGKNEQGVHMVLIDTFGLKKARREYKALGGFFSYALIGEWRNHGQAFPQDSMRIMRVQ